MASIPDEDENYNSASDEDFNPNAAPTAADDAALSSSDEDQDTSTPKKPTSKKRKDSATGVDDADFENSGDETVIRKARRKRRKGQGEDDGDDEEGGEGGLVKTRAQRAKEGKERNPLASTKGATVDVDALWASMQASSKPGARNEQLASTEGEKPEDSSSRPSSDKTAAPIGRSLAIPTSSQTHVPEDDDLITITHSTTFAGQTTTETKRVPRNSAEAKLYLQSHLQSSPTNPSSQPPLRRPKKRSSLFEPATVTAKSTQPVKLNTIEKSKLDWAGFVDKEGIAEELETHGKAKEGYLGRMEFLGRVEQTRDEAARRK